MLSEGHDGGSIFAKALLQDTSLNLRPEGMCILSELDCYESLRPERSVFEKETGAFSLRRRHTHLRCTRAIDLGSCRFTVQVHVTCRGLT